MKKNFLTLIILFSLLPNSYAHMGHYNKFNKLEMEVLRNMKAKSCDFKKYDKFINQ